MELSLKLRWPDFLLIAISGLTAHLYFVADISAGPISGFLIAFVVFKFLRQNNYARMSLVLSLFSASFLLIDFNFPLIGRIFWPIDHFMGALILYGGMKILKLPIGCPQWRFNWDRQKIFSIIAITIPTLIVLCIYFHYHQDIAQKWPLPQMSPWMVPIVVVLIALINGLREEILFRFTLQNGLSQLGSPVTAIVCSSLFFGYIHFTNGFPQGGLGVVLTILYGVLVGAQFFYFKSASLTWLTHSLADAIMFFVILMNRQV